MKSRFSTVLLAVLALLPFASLYYWLNAPYINARLLLASFDRDKGRRDDTLGPSICGFKDWKLSLNTFTDELDIWQIKSLYQIACERLESEFGKESIRAYTYLDQLGYGRQVAVVRIREGLDSESHLAVTFLHNNDNYMVSFEHVDEPFSAGDKKAISSWHLEPGLW